MKLKLSNGIPRRDIYKKLISNDNFYQMKNFSDEFIKDNMEVIKYYSQKWVPDPLFQWSRQWEYPYTYQNIKDYIKSSGNHLKLLDAGSGVTFFPFYLKSNFNVSMDCCDIDVNLNEIFSNINKNYLSDVHLSDVQFTNANIKDTPFEDNYFDLVYSISVLEHLEDHEEVLAEFNRILKIDGRLIITFDISIDKISEISIYDTSKLLQAIFEYFEPVTSTFEPFEELKVINNERDILTTKFIYKLDKRLLPNNNASFNYKISKSIENLVLHRTPRFFSNMTIYCICLKKR